MNINDLTIGQVKEVASFAAGIGGGCKPTSSVAGEEVRIVILQRGWVVVGYYRRELGRVLVTKASVIRNWGTTKGIGELTAGPTSSTKLDPCGEVDAHELAEVASIKCDTAMWAKVLG